MPIINLSITKPEKQWNIISKALSKNKHGVNGDGVCRHIAMELNKRYALNGDCKNIKVTVGIKRRRCFRINVDDDIFCGLQNEANQLGVQPSDLISILFLNQEDTTPPEPNS